MKAPNNRIDRIFTDQSQESLSKFDRLECEPIYASSTNLSTITDDDLDFCFLRKNGPKEVNAFP